MTEQFRYYQLVENIITRNRYRVMGCCKVKQGGDWVEAVLYCPEPANGQTYCRLKSEFESMFKGVAQ